MNKHCVVATQSEPQPPQPPPPCCSLCYLHFLVSCDLCDDGQWAALGSCSASEAATAALVVVTRAAALHGARGQPPGPGRRQGARRTTPHGDRRPCLRGCGRRLRLRWPGRRVRQPRAVTWLPAPLLAVSSLRGADGVDDTAVKYLLRAELKKKKEEEEERKQELADEVLDDKLEAEFDALMAIGHLTSRQEARLSAVVRERLELVERRKKRRTMRKRKKRRKRKTPKTSSSCGRAHRQQQQCYVHDWFSWCLLLALCPVLRSSNPGCYSWAVMYQKDSYQWPLHGWFCWLCHLCAVFPFIVGSRPSLCSFRRLRSTRFGFSGR